MPQRYLEAILKYLASRDYRPMKPRQLARRMGVAEEEYGSFREGVKQLADSGRLVLGAKNALTLPEVTDRMVGFYRANPRGFGFVIPETPNAHGDLFIPPGAEGGAMTGDQVAAKVVRRGRRDGREVLAGQIVEILQRGRNRFVGTLRRAEGNWFVLPDGGKEFQPIVVPDVPADGPKEGDKVVAEILQFAKAGELPTGVLVESLGAEGQIAAETRAVIRAHGLREDWPAEALEEVRRAAEAFDPSRADGREDLTGHTIVTIDPADAKDYDDAISLEELPGGGFRLGVHIADVSHFVRERTALDAEARARTTSTYFPRRVVPMLPELLSNGLCSLQEGQRRFCLSAFIDYDAQAEVRGTRFAQTVIASARRLTYEQAQDICDGRTGGPLRGEGVPPLRREGILPSVVSSCASSSSSAAAASSASAIERRRREEETRGRDARETQGQDALATPYSPAVVELVQRMEKLARLIEARRARAGMLHLDLPEVRLVLDEAGKVIDAVPEDSSYTHTIIEMFMVEANEAAAGALSRADRAFLRRIHPAPPPEDVRQLGAFVRACGHRVPAGLGHKELQELLKGVRGRPEAFAVNLAVLRTFERAEYSPMHVGHFALASRDYCHFTSPIRRYPDLTVHRLLRELILGRLAQRPPEDLSELTRLGAHCSAGERRSEAAEGELRQVLVLQLLEGKIGESFEGVLTGVTNFGVFVQLRRLLIEGLIRLEDLGDDWWEVDARTGQVRGQTSGRRIRIGDVLEVRVAGVDVARRQLNLVPSREQPQGAKKGRRSRGPRRAR